MSPGDVFTVRPPYGAASDWITGATVRVLRATPAAGAFSWEVVILDREFEGEAAIANVTAERLTGEIGWFPADVAARARAERMSAADRRAARERMSADAERGIAARAIASTERMSPDDRARVAEWLRRTRG